MVAEGLVSLLSGEFDVVGVAEDGRALIEAARRLKPDVIVADINMPRLNGLDAMDELKRNTPRAKVVFLTMHHDVAYARRALEAGALGFVLKHSAPDELLLAIRAAIEGKTFVTPALAGEVLRSMGNGPAAAGPAAGLSSRQREILRHMAEGLTAKEIANALGISSRTVEFHKYNLMETLGLKTSADLIRFAIKQGLA